MFLNQITGRVRAALDELIDRSSFSYGVAQRTGGLAVRKPDGSLGLLPFGYLAENAPEPFKSEWSGNTTGYSNMVYHKFLVTDFNGYRPMLFTGSSNMAKGGEEDNGDHLICIEDRKVAISYAIEALRLFDHFYFRVKVNAAGASNTLRHAKPPSLGKKASFSSHYRNGHVIARPAPVHSLALSRVWARGRPHLRLRMTRRSRIRGYLRGFSISSP